jgi:hypothetical protein
MAGTVAKRCRDFDKPRCLCDHTVAGKSCWFLHCDDPSSPPSSPPSKARDFDATVYDDSAWPTPAVAAVAKKSSPPPSPPAAVGGGGKARAVLTVADAKGHCVDGDCGSDGFGDGTISDKDLDILGSRLLSYLKSKKVGAAASTSSPSSKKDDVMMVASVATLRIDAPMWTPVGVMGFK